MNKYIQFKYKSNNKEKSMIYVVLNAALSIQTHDATISTNLLRYAPPHPTMEKVGLRNIKDFQGKRQQMQDWRFLEIKGNLGDTLFCFDVDETLLLSSGEPIEGALEKALELHQQGADTCLVTYNSFLIHDIEFFKQLMSQLGHQNDPHLYDLDLICAKINPKNGFIEEARLVPYKGDACNPIEEEIRCTQEEDSVDLNYQPLGWTRGKGLVISPILQDTFHIQIPFLPSPYGEYPYINKGYASVALWKALGINPRNIVFIDDNEPVVEFFAQAMTDNYYDRQTIVVNYAPDKTRYRTRSLSVARTPPTFHLERRALDLESISRDILPPTFNRGISSTLPVGQAPVFSDVQPSLYSAHDASLGKETDYSPFSCAEIFPFSLKKSFDILPFSVTTPLNPCYFSKL